MFVPTYPAPVPPPDPYARDARASHEHVRDLPWILLNLAKILRPPPPETCLGCGCLCRPDERCPGCAARRLP